VDSTLGDLSGLIQQAQTTASANVGSDSTASQRQTAAELVQNVTDQVLSIGNKTFNGAYLFGGTKSNQAPFVSQNGSIQFVGSTNVASNTSDDNATLPYMIDGATVFGALQTQVAGTVNLAPALAADTRLVDLGGTGGTGVQLGSIRLGNGAATVDVDLSHADTVGDLVNTINAAGLAGVTASLGTDGIQLSGTGNISVNEVGGGSTAADLGIATPVGGGAGVPINGQSLSPQVTSLTRLSDLRGGAGLDLSGLTITNGGTKTALNFTGDTTVEGVLNTINGSKAGVLARINAAGTGIDIVNKTQGSALSVAENGGATAAQLGLQSTSPTTPLSSLNGGQGVRAAVPAAPDFQITRADGTTFSVSVGNSHTMQDVINAINTADGGGGVTASFGSNSNGIVLTDSTGGGGTVAVAPLNGSAAAQDLGILTPASGNTITGSDVNPVNASGVFADLQKLTTALQANDTGGITAAATALQNDYSQVVLVRGETGAKEQAVQSKQSQLSDETLATQTLLSSLQDTDLPTAISKFQTLQTALEANYAMSAKVLNLSLLNFLA
jgi:flagellin-like hook-associated protein FlgL